jgi:arylsulfatase A-like enzyme
MRLGLISQPERSAGLGRAPWCITVALALATLEDLLYRASFQSPQPWSERLSTWGFAVTVGLVAAASHHIRLRTAILSLFALCLGAWLTIGPIALAGSLLAPFAVTIVLVLFAGVAPSFVRGREFDFRYYCLALSGAVALSVVFGTALSIPGPPTLDSWAQGFVLVGVLVLPIILGERVLWMAPLAFLPQFGTEAWSDDLPKADAASSPDVILITVDALRSDVARTMESYELLSREGTSFDGQAASCWTVPSLPAIHTGLEPEHHGCGLDPTAHVITQIAPGVRTLAERLADAGYDTGATISWNGLVPLTGLTRGFARWRYHGPQLEARPVWPLSSRPIGFVPGLFSMLGFRGPPATGADLLVEDIESYLSTRRDRPMFLWAHFFDPHTPYRHAREMVDLSWVQGIELAGAQAAALDDEPAALRKRLYENQVTTLDRAILRLLRRLPSRNTIIVFTSDHGEELDDHGGWDHGHTMYQELLSVPLVVSGIPALPAGVDGGIAGQIDITPTLLAALGLEHGGLDGVDLATDRGSDRAFRSSRPLLRVAPVGLSAVRQGTRKVIEDGHGTIVGYDLAHDPHELHPLAPPPDLVALLPVVTLGAETGREPDAHGALRALGYVQ